ncbi:glycosyltransferase family 2 protein [Cohnella sp. 56]|uniref:glycosyltransferase family 2 protein n=1 Tax=Cohnella sp. 56 TaxID=3113722 RepID=UPI0030E93573
MRQVGKIVVFIPAYNEEPSIGRVIRAVPREFLPGCKVEVVVIDDGSHDGTVRAARAAGADHILSWPSNRGLGAAVREGLRQCCLLDADIGLMIDADDEYPAEQLPEVLGPIINGEADYTMGSRFMGTSHDMTLTRRIGNYGFTLLQCLLLRCWIRDGQSGMRGFSREAMARARIVHDYNYAQVITLNLLRQGFRVKEVPIRYRVRTQGESFIRFGTYVRKVLPAIWRELRSPVDKRGTGGNGTA